MSGKWKIPIVILVAFFLRCFYALDLPLNGDEVGVGVLQAAGQAVDFEKRLPDGNAPRESLEKFIRYSEEYSEKDVINSLRYAGMHPPFYYLLLHYLLKYFGNSAPVLRSLSLLASLLSVVYIYRLGRTLFDEKIGFYSALILALSGYGIWMGTLVRPYALVMLISLATTYQALKLHLDHRVSLRNYRIYLYALTVILGLYTLYHFLFVFAFQIVFLLLGHYKDKKTLGTLVVVVALVLAGFLPLVPFLLDQMKAVTGGDYYFHQQVNIAHFIGDALSINFIRYFHLSYFPTKVVLALICGLLAGGLIILGLYRLSRESTGRIFISAMVLYFLIYCSLEAALGMSTFQDIKMLFFVFPVLVIFLTSGLIGLPQRFHLKTIALPVFCLLLLANTAAACLTEYKLGGDGRYLEMFPAQIQSRLSASQKALVLINTHERRYLFPLVHAVNADVDLKILDYQDITTQTRLLHNLKDYDYVFLINIKAYRTTPPFPVDDIELMCEFLRKHNFFLQEYIDSGYKPLLRAMYVFQRRLD